MISTATGQGLTHETNELRFTSSVASLGARSEENLIAWWQIAI